jgi:MFS family permease
VDRLGAARLFWPAMVVAGVAAVGVATAPLLWLLTLCAWIRSVPVALTGTVLYAHLAEVCSRAERAPVMSLTPVPRNLAQFSLTLVASAAANLGTSVALLVGAFVYGVATWVGVLLERETDMQKERSRWEPPL